MRTVPANLSRTAKPTLVLALCAIGVFDALAPAQQVVWNRRRPSVAPPPTERHLMAYDSARQVIVLYGGTRLMDTWELGLDSSSRPLSWQLASKAGPPPRSHHAMAYHAATGKTIVFGGNSGGGTNDTWAWDAKNWVLLTPSQRPSRRVGARLANDDARRELVLFGGSRGTVFDQTWTWDGTTWTRRSPATTPPGRQGQGMAFDQARQRVVMFGGVDGSSNALTDTWEWDGSDWIERFPLNNPPGGIHALAYDDGRRRVVAFGGPSQGQKFAWEWDGTNWAISLTSPPPPRGDHAMAYFAACGRVILFGGSTGSTVFNDQWEYYLSYPAQFTALGGGCAGSAGVPVLAPAAGQLPWFCSTPFTLELSSLPGGPSNPAFGILGVSNTMWRGVVLPIELGFIGMPGCVLTASPDLLVGLTRRGGVAAMTIQLPALPGLVGNNLYAQGLVVDPPANPLGLITTNAACLTIGAR